MRTTSLRPDPLSAFPRPSRHILWGVAIITFLAALPSTSRAQAQLTVDFLVAEGTRIVTGEAGGKLAFTSGTQGTTQAGTCVNDFNYYPVQIATSVAPIGASAEAKINVIPVWRSDIGTVSAPVEASLRLGNLVLVHDCSIGTALYRRWRGQAQ